jgi:nitrite reductase/ring-hydroxylating ferredoxin subunit
MSRYLCRVEEIGEAGKEIEVRTDSTVSYIMLFRYAGAVRAFLNVCPHQGRPLNWAPDRFLFSPEGLLVCAQHGASFELDTGECVDGPCRGARLRMVKISLEQGSARLEQELD